MTRQKRIILKLIVAISLVSIFISCMETVEDNSLPDVYSPLVESTTPKNGDIGVSARTHVQVTFVEEIDPTSVLVNTVDSDCSGNIQISDNDFADCLVMATAPSSNDNMTFTVRPEFMVYENNYKYRILGGIRDISGIALEETYTTPDGFLVKPISITSIPSDNSPNIEIDTGITVSFDEAMDTSTVSTNTVDTSCSGSIQVSKDDFVTCVQMSDDPVSESDDKAFSIKPLVNLDSNTIYKIKTTTQIKDSEGNIFQDPYTTSTGFKTFDYEWVTTSPANRTTDILLGSVISVDFAMDMDPTTVSTNTSDSECSGSIQVSKDDFSTCVRMDSEPVSSDEDQTFSLHPVVNLDSNSIYKIKVTSDVMDGTGGNGLLSDYISETGFTTDDVQWIASTTPSNSGTNVPLGSSISLTFAQAMNPATVSTNTSDSECTGSIQVSKDEFDTCVRMDSEPVSSDEDKTFSLQPVVNLDSITNYKIKVTSTVMDATGGNGLLTDYITPAGFTTRDIITSFSPVDGATYVAISSGIVVSFTEAIDTTTLTSNFTDTSCSGSIQVSKDSFSTCVRMSASPNASNGDKTFSLQPASDLAGSTTYQIKVTSAVKDATGGNAVVTDYTTATGFTTREAIPPNVSSVCPSNSVSDVALDTQIYVTFDETMDVSTITADTSGTSCSGCIQVSNDDFSSCVTMSGSPTASMGDTSFNLQPASTLGGGKTFKIRVTASAQDVAGNNMANQYTTSTGFSTLAGFSQASAGYYHTCAVLSDNTVNCWGDGYQGQLGNGSTSDQTTPVSVSSISTATQVSAGYYHTCAVLSDNTVNCWGDGGYGQLGNGSTSDQTTPVTVSSISTATQVSVGYYHTCAVLSDNTVKCWGRGYQGQLGNGSTSEQTTPVAVDYSPNGFTCPVPGSPSNQAYDFETSNNSDISQSSDSDTAWERTSADPKNGVYSYKAGSISNNQKSCFEISNNYSTVSFFKKVSSELNYDYLRFYIDDAEQDNWSGSGSWSSVAESYTTDSGNHTYKWCYTKDGSVSSGADTAYIDDITFQ